MTLRWRVRDRCFVRGQIGTIRALYLAPRAALVRTESGDVLLVCVRELELVPLPGTSAHPYRTPASVAALRAPKSPPRPAAPPRKLSA